MDTPAAFNQAIKLYQLMRQTATSEPMEFDDKTVDVLVWEGRLTTLVMTPSEEGGLGLSNPYYTKLTKILRKTGCIDQLRRGGGGNASKWILLREPTIEDLQGFAEAGVIEGRKGVADNQKFLDLNQRINELTDDVEFLKSRVDELEAKIA